MRTIQWICVVLCLAGGLAPGPAEEEYERHEIEGWVVHVNRELSRDHGDISVQVLRLLEIKLYDIEREVPSDALAKLKKVPIWVEWTSKTGTGAVYHPSAAWLKDHGFNPAWAKGAQICNAKNFLSWSHQQPWMVLHELAHAYHHQVLGYEYPPIKEAYRKAVEGKKYEKVLLYNGKTVKHYGLNNDQEYFAEASEAYFGVNDFFPFVRAELKEFDPEGYAVVKEAWEKK